MSWVMIDDQLHAHPKVNRCWQENRAALGLHMLALSYCGCYSTDGRVPLAFVAEKLPQATQRTRAVAALSQSGLWVPDDGSWTIHDYLVYNKSREQVQREQAAKSAAGKRGATRRWAGARA